MRKQNLLTTRQFVVLLYVLFTAFTALQSPGILIYQAERDAWISVIIAWILDITLGLVYAKMGVRFKTQSFVQYSETILGKYLGKILGMVFPLSFFLMIPMFLSSLSMVITKAFLPKTPSMVILVSSYIVIGYSARKGIVAIGRACEIAGPIFLVSMFMLFALILPWSEIGNVKPILDSGIYPVFSGALFILSFLGVCIMMGMFIPISERPENGMKAKFVASTMGSITIGLLVVFTIGTFGIQQAYNMFYPSLQVARIINIGQFIQRIDIVWIVVAIAATLIGASILMWGACEGFSQVMKIKDNLPIVYPLTLLSLVLAITTFKSDKILKDYIFYFFPFLSVIMTVIEILLMAVAMARKKKGSE